jgi:hypothetical protein
MRSGTQRTRREALGIGPTSEPRNREGVLDHGRPETGPAVRCGLLAPVGSNHHYRIQSRTGSGAAYSNSCVYKMFSVGGAALLPPARANSAEKLVQKLDQPRQSLGTSPPLPLLAPV